VVLLAPQVLRQAGWCGEPFLGVKLQDPTWTRARWEQAQARQQGRSLEGLKVPWVDGEDTKDTADEGTDDALSQGPTRKEDRLREPAGPQRNGTGPDNPKPPGHLADDLAWLEGLLQQHQQTLEAHADDTCWAPLQVTHEAGVLAQQLLHGWQVQQAVLLS
jgi:hypothetical protein